MYNRRILPFYMTYPLPIGYQEEDMATRDFEYLQQLYPIEAKKCHKMVSETLDRMDYEGSIIYDEYPDQWQLYRLSRDIIDRMKRAGEADSDQWEMKADLVLIVLHNEVFRRRHCSRKGILHF